MIEHSSQADFKQRLDEGNIDLGSTAFEEGFARMQRVSDLTGKVSDTQMQAIVDEVVSGTETLQGVAESFR